VKLSGVMTVDAGSTSSALRFTTGLLHAVKSATLRSPANPA
jgi:hypothetical protein